MSLRDERLDIGRAVLSDVRSNYRPEPREPCILEEGRREQSPELKGGEQEDNGAGEVGERDKKEVPGSGEVPENLDGFECHVIVK